MDADQESISEAISLMPDLDWQSVSPPIAVEYLGPVVAAQLTRALLCAYACRCRADYREAERLTLQLLISIAVKEGWAREDRRRGLLTELASDAIEHLFSPIGGAVANRSARRWAFILKLEHARVWREVWGPRYAELLHLLADIAQAGVDLAFGKYPALRYALFLTGGPQRSKQYVV